MQKSDKSEDDKKKAEQKEEKMSNEEEEDDDDDDDDDEIFTSSDDDNFVESEQSIEMHKELQILPDQKYHRYKIIESLSKQTFIAEDLLSNNEKVVVKIYDNFNLKQNNNSGFIKLISEVYSHSVVESKFVLTFYEYFQVNGISGVATQYCPNNLLNYLEQRKDPFSVGETIKYLKQILIGLSSLHKHHLVHNAISLKDLVIGNDSFIKISNFSQSVQLKKENNFLTDQKIKIIPETAPEIIYNKKYGLQADIYSLGIIIYQMLFKEYPNGINKNVLNEIDPSQYTPIDPEKIDFNFNDVAIPDKIKKLLKSMLQPNPTYRVQFRNIYETIMQFSSQEEKIREKKISLNSPRNNFNELTPEQDIDRQFQLAIQNEFFLLDEMQGYGSLKLKKEQQDMEKIYKNTKNTTIDIWDFDYTDAFGKFSQNIIPYSQEIVLENQNIMITASEKDQRFVYLKSFEKKHYYDEEVKILKKCLEKKKLMNYIAPMWGFSDIPLQYSYSGGVANVLEFSDFRVENMIPWSIKELIYLFKTLINGVLELYDSGVYHSDLKAENLAIEYNQKNGRLELKIMNFSRASSDPREPKLKNHNYIFGPQTFSSKQNIESAVVKCETAEKRIHQEILDCIYIFLEMCVKSYFPNRPQTLTSGQQKQEKNLLVVYTLQEKIIKEAQKFPSEQQKCEFYLREIRTSIFSEIFYDQNGNEYDFNDMSKSICNTVADEQGSERLINKDSNLKENMNQSCQPKFPFARPEIKKSQFSSSNLNEVIDSGGIDASQNNGSLKNNSNPKLKNSIEMTLDEAFEQEDEMEEQQEDIKENQQQQQVRNLLKVNNNNNNNSSSAANKQNKHNMEDTIDQATREIYTGFRILIDTIHYILLPKLYTLSGLREFMNKREVFFNFNKILDAERTIEDVLNSKIEQKIGSFEKFSSKAVSQGDIFRE